MSFNYIYVIKVVGKIIFILFFIEKGTGVPQLRITNVKFVQNSLLYWAKMWAQSV
jgi:hypothetical protein